MKISESEWDFFLGYLQYKIILLVGISCYKFWDGLKDSACSINKN